MNKKIIVLMMMSIFLVSIFGVGVNAGITDQLKENELLKWIFYDLAKDLISDSPTVVGLIMARFLVAILVISLMSGVAAMVLGNMPKGARIGVSIAIGLIAAAAIPEKMLIMLYLAYSGLIITVMLAAPLIGIFWIMFTQFNEPKREHYLVKFILMLIASLIVSIASASDTTAAMTTSGIGKTMYGYVNSIFGILSFVVYILLFWYLYKTVSPGDTKVDELVAKGSGKAVNWLSRKTNRSVRNIARLSFGRAGFLGIVKAAQDAKAKFILTGASAITETQKNGLVTGVRNKLRRTEGVEKRIEGFTEYMANIIDKCTDEDLKTNLKKDIEGMVAADEAILSKVNEISEDLIKGSNMDAGDWNTVITKSKQADNLEKSSERIFLKLRGKLRGKTFL